MALLRAARFRRAWARLGVAILEAGAGRLRRHPGL